MSSLVEPFRSRAVSRLALAGGSCRRHRRLQQRLLPLQREPLGFEAAGFAAGQRGLQRRDRLGPPASRADRTRSRASAAAPRRPTAAAPASASYQPAAAAQPSVTGSRPEYTGSISAAPPRQPAQSWSWDGGTAVVVAQGETIDTISRRHGVPAPAILQANNMTPCGAAAAGPAPGHPAPRQCAPTPGRRRRPASRVRRATRRRRRATRMSSRPARRSTRSRATTGTTPMAIAKANNVGLDHQRQVGDRVVIPGSASRAAHRRLQRSRRRSRRRSRSSRRRAARSHAGREAASAEGRSRSSRRRTRAWSRRPPIRCPRHADRHDRQPAQRGAELPLAGARPRHHGLRPEDERRTE